ncbi:MAG: hypothetical protein CVU22_17990 [Betaproteobacteria bacterium HGW-Betaproteobacteria-16]|nr:MAG: hypothetical protein CVU22_17990 [Betaproteobacteria bacterium HGW-Betaproteobacteria-16]
MRTSGRRYLFAALLSVTLHVVALSVAGLHQFRANREFEAPAPSEMVVFLEVMPTQPDDAAPVQRPAAIALALEPPAKAAQAIKVPSATAEVALPSERDPVFMEAPPAPSAQEWALAAGYSLKNSKRYRYTWGQQVRSMMGTAIEGPDQGVVRFRIEIAPEGTLVRLETLWTTSAKAESLARKAVENMPSLPPTPTGRPLIFEKTISFQPFAQDDAPIYKYDCEPDPPGFSNPFVFDGRSPPVATVQPPEEELAPLALEDCLKQLPQDSFEGEIAHDQRQLKQWGSSQLAR